MSHSMPYRLLHFTLLPLSFNYIFVRTLTFVFTLQSPTSFVRGMYLCACMPVGLLKGMVINTLTNQANVICSVHCSVPNSFENWLY